MSLWFDGITSVLHFLKIRRAVFDRRRYEMAGTAISIDVALGLFYVQRAKNE
jgi:hypothetical protein